MKIMKINYAPIAQADLVLAELSFEATMRQIADQDHYADIRVDGKAYRVNMGASRLQVLKKNPLCACCGIRATDASLDLDAKRTKETGNFHYHVNLYARSGEHGKDHQHMILLTKDHVVPRSKGGKEEESNFQTLCANCNFLKDNADLDLEHMRKILFPAYRAYLSSKAIYLAKQELLSYYNLLDKNRRAINNISQALLIVHESKAENLRDRLHDAIKTVEKTQNFIAEFEKQAQITGTVPVLDER